MKKQYPRKKYIPGHPDADRHGGVYVHRLVAMEMLGRMLREDEVVLWKNGDRHDNRPENLEVTTRAELRRRTNARGEDHGLWRGGRTKAANGYVWVRCPSHPEAKKYHGYVPEHRLVMEEMLGRPLRDGEVVHHDDEDRSNNDPGNLCLYDGNGLHTHEHGSNPSSRRRPGDPNPLVPCACGCGELIRKYDKQGVRRRFKYKHWARTQKRAG